jgi:Spy/CpxP family protein refolding chaperone
MKKLVLAALLLAPLTALAQAGAGPGPGPGGGMGPGMGRGPGPGPGWRDGDGPGPGRGERGKRAKLALTLGLAEALDLDDAQALKLRDAVEKFHQKREPLHTQLRETMQVLRTAADGDKADAAAVDQALARLLDLRAQAQVADRELVQAVTRDQPPAKKARAVLFLSRFQHRMEERMGPMGRGGHRGLPGMRRGQGRGMGPCGQGLGPCGGAPGAGRTGALGNDVEPLAAVDPAPPLDGDEL